MCIKSKQSLNNPSKWWRETLQRQRKSKYTSLEESYVAVGKTVLKDWIISQRKIGNDQIWKNYNLFHDCHEQGTIQKMKLDTWAFLYGYP